MGWGNRGAVGHGSGAVGRGGHAVTAALLSSLLDGHQLKRWRQRVQGRTPIWPHAPRRGRRGGHSYRGWDLFYFTFWDRF